MKRILWRDERMEMVRRREGEEWKEFTPRISSRLSREIEMGRDTCSVSATCKQIKKRSK